MTYALISILLLLSSGGCDNKDEETSGERPRPENVVYSEVITPPSISQIDESGYKTYYVDSQTGSDANNGLTSESPFQTLDKVSNMVKEPATKVLFKSGAVFKGTLTLKDLKGTPEKPFIVDIYGGSERARFEGTGGEQVVLIQDDNIRFRNIFVTNKTGKRGMYIRAIEAGAKKNIEVTGCRFEEINWAGDAAFVGVSRQSLTSGLFVLMPTTTRRLAVSLSKQLQKRRAPDGMKICLLPTMNFIRCPVPALCSLIVGEAVQV